MASQSNRWKVFIFWLLLSLSDFFDGWDSQLSGQESGTVPNSRSWMVPLGFPQHS